MANKLQNNRRKRIKQLRSKGKTLADIGQTIGREEKRQPLSVQLVKYYLK